MSAIPTKYGGVQFRSRLEARWAVMFDQLDWRWEYEPVDLDGYIPDFILLFPAGGVLVEVKPRFTVDALIAEAAKKIDDSGWTSGNNNNALIVGATCAPEDEWHYEAAGALRQFHETDSGNNYPGIWAAASWFTCGACRRSSLYQVEQCWWCLLCGRSDGDRFIGPPPDIRAMWADAGNAVQWRAPRRR